LSFCHGKEHYHFIIEGDGTVIKGDHDISDNVSTADDDYAAHTRACNTGSIGVSWPINRDWLVKDFEIFGGGSDEGAPRMKFFMDRRASPDWAVRRRIIRGH
jgi:hypothetical protein